MSFIDNINVLREKFPQLWATLEVPDPLPENGGVSKGISDGSPVLLVKPEEGGEPVYLHSKYDPLREAELFISQYQDLAAYDQIICFGMGFGYHIQVLGRLYPEKSIIVYEPGREIFFYYLHHGTLKELPLKSISNIYVESQEKDREQFARMMLKKYMGQKTMIMILPSYQRIFATAYKEFTKAFFQSHREDRLEWNTTQRFQKLWSRNSLLNLKETINAPDAFLDVDRNYFAGKPVLLVAAGPSLTYEIENIREIKNSERAYIIAAGSSLSVLLNHDIAPDAVCTYDPNPHNHLVIEPLIERGIKDIPLIFGSCVDSKTLELYDGPKLRVLSSEDRLSQFLLKPSDKSKHNHAVDDSPTVTAIALQILAGWGADPIILVGQNLAYSEDRIYPKGIKYYDNGPGPDLRHAIVVEDVTGNKVKSTESFIAMRTALENWIRRYSNIRVINTTKGGAKIAGTEYCSLEALVKTELAQTMAIKEWFPRTRSTCNQKYFVNQLDVINRAMVQLEGQIEDVEQILKKMEIESLRGYKASDRLRLLLPKFDKALGNLLNNKAHHLLIHPMNRTSHEQLEKRLKQARAEGNLVRKTELVLRETPAYCIHCRRDWQEVMPIWITMYKMLLESVE